MAEAGHLDLLLRLAVGVGPLEGLLEGLVAGRFHPLGDHVHRLFQAQGLPRRAAGTA